MTTKHGISTNGRQARLKRSRDVLRGLARLNTLLAAGVLAAALGLSSCGAAGLAQLGDLAALAQAGQLQGSGAGQFSGGNGNSADDDGTLDQGSGDRPQIPIAPGQGGSVQPGGSVGNNGAVSGEIERRGAIEALTASTITVGGLTFTHNAATEWQVGDNHHASPSQFSVGQAVKVEGFQTAGGELIAREVKDSAADGSGRGRGGDDD